MIERLDVEVRRELDRVGPIEGDTTAIARVWARAVGETVARNAWPARIARDGTLQVTTSSATWAFELGRLAETLLARLRTELGDETPRALKCVPGPVPEPHFETASAQSAPAREIALEHRSEAASIAAGIEDESLRRLVARAAAASLANARREPPDDRGF